VGVGGFFGGKKRSNTEVEQRRKNPGYLPEVLTDVICRKKRERVRNGGKATPDSAGPQVCEGE